MKHIFIIVSFLTLTAVYAQENTLFKEANALYNEEKYAEAAEVYNKIIDSGVHSAELYYNLANAHYKLNNIAPSIYYYEKALQLKPNDSEIKNNLSFAQNMTIDAIEVVPEIGLAKLYHNSVTIFSTQTWAILAIVFIFLFVVLFITYYLETNTLKKRIAFIGILVFLSLGLLSITLAFQSNNLNKSKHPAIIFAKEVSVKNSPNPNSEEVFKLHEGSKVFIAETFNNWFKIKLANGQIGWVESKTLKEL